MRKKIANVVSVALNPFGVSLAIILVLSFESMPSIIGRSGSTLGAFSSVIAAGVICRGYFNGRHVYGDKPMVENKRPCRFCRRDVNRADYYIRRRGGS